MRGSLKHKLEQLGVKGNVLEIITSIYSLIKISLSEQNYVPICTCTGLKQGDILSRMFFNLFINDLPMIKISLS